MIVIGKSRDNSSGGGDNRRDAWSSSLFGNSRLLSNSGGIAEARTKFGSQEEMRINARERHDVMGKRWFKGLQYTLKPGNSVHMTVVSIRKCLI